LLYGPNVDDPVVLLRKYLGYDEFKNCHACLHMIDYYYCLLRHRGSTHYITNIQNNTQSIKTSKTMHNRERETKFRYQLAARLWWFTAAPKPLKILVFWGSPSPQLSQSPYILGDTTRPGHVTCVLVWSKSDWRRLRKTLHKQTDKQTDRQTNRHNENNGHLAVNQQSERLHSTLPSWWYVLRQKTRQYDIYYTVLEIHTDYTVDPIYGLVAKTNRTGLCSLPRRMLVHFVSLTYNALLLLLLLFIDCRFLRLPAEEEGNVRGGRNPGRSQVSRKSVPDSDRRHGGVQSFQGEGEWCGPRGYESAVEWRHHQRHRCRSDTRHCVLCLIARRLAFSAFTLASGRSAGL